LHPTGNPSTAAPPPLLEESMSRSCSHFARRRTHRATILEATLAFWSSLLGVFDFGACLSWQTLSDNDALHQAKPRWLRVVTSGQSQGFCSILHLSCAAEIEERSHCKTMLPLTTSVESA